VLTQKTNLHWDDLPPAPPQSAAIFSKIHFSCGQYFTCCQFQFLDQ